MAENPRMLLPNAKKRIIPQSTTQGIIWAVDEYFGDGIRLEMPVITSKSTNTAATCMKGDIRDSTIDFSDIVLITFIKCQGADIVLEISC